MIRRRGAILSAPGLGADRIAGASSLWPYCASLRIVRGGYCGPPSGTGRRVGIPGCWAAKLASPRPTRQASPIRVRMMRVAIPCHSISPCTSFPAAGGAEYRLGWPGPSDISSSARWGRIQLSSRSGDKELHEQRRLAIPISTGDVIAYRRRNGVACRIRIPADPQSISRYERSWVISRPVAPALRIGHIVYTAASCAGPLRPLGSSDRRWMNVALRCGNGCVVRTAA